MKNIWLTSITILTICLINVQAHAATTWGNASSVPVANINAVASNGTISVAVGDNGKIITTDGTTKFPNKMIFTQQTSGTTATLTDVIWTGTTFAAVGTNIVLTSVDGVTWLGNPTGNVTDFWNSIAWDGTWYIIVGASGNIKYSWNALSWTTAASGTTSALNKVIHNGTKYVAVGSFGEILTSTVGVSWTAQTSGTAFGLKDVAWSGTQFVAVGTAGAILTSPDAITWTKQTSIIKNFNSITWQATQGIFLISGGGGNILWSTDGITWTANSSGATLNLNDISWLSSNTTTNQYIAVGNAGAVYTSADGAKWTLADSTIAPNLKGIIFDGTQFVAVGESGTVQTSTDALTWKAQTSGNTTQLNDIAWNGTVYVAVGGVLQGTIYYSADAITWTLAYTNPSWLTGLNSVKWGGSQFVAVGNRGALISSPDGITWTAQTSGVTADLVSVAYGNGNQFITVGAGGTILRNFFGTIWTAQTSSMTSTFQDITWGNNEYVAVGWSGKIYTSKFGVTWTDQSVTTGGTLNHTLWTGSTYVATGSSGAILTSPDAITWSNSSQSGTKNNLNASVFANGQVVTVGDNGTIIIGSSQTVLAEITPVPALANANTALTYTFSSDTAGTIAYAGDCTSTTAAATVGNNTVTFAAMAEGTHANCTIKVGNSSALSVGTFKTDTIAPVITLKGAATINLTAGGYYFDKGANATELLSSSISKGGSFINALKAGTYTITYDVADAAGNNAVQVVRNIIVAATPITPATDTVTATPESSYQQGLEAGAASTITPDSPAGGGCLSPSFKMENMLLLPMIALFLVGLCRTRRTIKL